MDTQQAQASFEEFVAGRSAALAKIAYLLTGHREDAEDLLQAALCRAAVRWTKIDDPEAYVRRILFTQSVSWWRTLKRRPPETLTDEPPTLPTTPTDHDLRLVLDDALRRLTPRQRAVLVLRFYEDLSESQTAQQLSCAVGTVKSQTRHALARLRQLNPHLATLVEDRPRSVVTR